MNAGLRAYLKDNTYAEELVEELDLAEDDVENYAWRILTLLKNAVQKTDVSAEYEDPNTTAGRAYRIYEIMTEASEVFRERAHALLTLVEFLRMENGFEL